jgi:tubulin monoglycylase TTLL15
MTLPFSTVDGYKFDIGIYTMITSIDPLRIYIYNGDSLLRFCPQKYYPFDPTNRDKYVVHDDYRPTW